MGIVSLITTGRIMAHPRIDMLHYVDTRMSGFQEELDRRFESLISKHDGDISSLKEVINEISLGLRRQDDQQETRLRSIEEKIVRSSATESSIEHEKEQQRKNVQNLIAIAGVVILMISVAVTFLIASHH
jgi:hypothetical protein